MIWELLAQLLGAKIKLTSPYYPQGNSVIERSHRTLSNMLRTMLLERKSEDWSTLLPSVMLYMNSMSQEKTGVSACEVLFGHNPNLPSDISYTPVTSLSNDREGYVKQLKRDLQDIRQKLSRILGHDRDQSVNPFSVGDKVIIALLPQENTHKFMPKWKGPFLVTKVPNRFQIEYFDGSVTRLTHISYAKKFNERCLRTQTLRPLQVSRRRARDRMARLRLIFGSGHNKMKWVIDSLDNIQCKWPIPPGRVRVKILGEEKDLPADLRELVEALDPDKCIEGKVLVDLCRQRSERRGNGCDVSRMFEDLPEPSASSSKMVHRPAVQVNRFSWFNNAKTDKHLDEKRREFRNSRKYPNSASFYPPQQAPLVSQKYLQAVVRKVARGNRFKGKKQQNFVVKEQQTNEHKVMTSLAHSRQKAEGGNQRDFYYKYHKELGTDGFASICQYKTSMHLVKPSGNQKEYEVKQSHFHQSDVMDDAIKVERGEQNKHIARKDHTAPKHSCSYVKEDDYPSVNISKQFFVQLACMLMMIGNVIKGVTSLNSLNLKRVIGLATLACVGWEYCVIAIPLPTVLPYVFGRKCSCAYSSLNTIIYASWIRYFEKYIYNLDFEYETRGSFKLVYSYIQASDSSQMIWNQATLSSKFATLPCNKLYTLVYLLSEWSFSVIIIHDKYHRQFLFGLTLVCNAILRSQCFLLRSCTNWEELRPLVTSRAYGIKEGFNPCVIQIQFMPWYALVSLSLLSLLSLTILLCYFYYCCFYYCCYYFIVTELYKTVTSLSFSLLLSLYISLFFSLLLLSVWCESNPAHTVTVVYFSLLLLAVWCGSNSVHTGAVVYSCLWLSFSLLLLTVWCESNPAHTVTVVYFSLLLLAVWCGSNSVHTGAVVYSCLWLSFSLLLLAV